MRNLKNAQELRIATAQKSSKRERKDLFKEILLNKEIHRDDVIDMIAIQMEDRYNETPLDDDQFQTLRKSCAKSVSNFISKSYRPSTATATFNGDPFYKAFIMERDGDILTVVERPAE